MLSNLQRMCYVVCALFGATEPQLKKRKAFRPFSTRTAPAIHRLPLLPRAAREKRLPPKNVKDSDALLGLSLIYSLAVPKACAVLRVIDCLLFLQENRFDAERFKDFPAVTMRFDFNHCHRTSFFQAQETLSACRLTAQ